MKTIISSKTFLFLFISIALGGILGGILIFIVSAIKNLPDPRSLNQRAIAQSTRIYDRTGTVLLYEIHGGEKRTIVHFSEIPDLIKNATRAAEDINFYHHHGLDWRGISRALITNILHGAYSQGGSTITQQLIKNSLLSGERTLTRKVKEALLALALEKKYTKDEIFESYLNQIPYGSNSYGIAAAAETYFSKKFTDLSLSEIALLAALPRAPTYYSPFGSHKETLLQRKNWILDRMADADFITPEQANSAKKEILLFSPPRNTIQAPHFVMYVREYLNQKYGEEFVEQGGLKVITTLDWTLQQHAQKIITEGAEKNEKLVQAKNAALVAINPKNGDIITMVGSRDYFDTNNDGNVNVTLRPRQPGSAFKPFIYATAFKKGYTPETVLFDVPTEFNPLCTLDEILPPSTDTEDKCYHPQNYDQKFRGPVTIRQALAQSLNVPSVKLLYLAGIKDSIKTAQDFGITTLTQPERYGLSLVLGGAEVTLLDMTSAFGAFAEDGIRHPHRAILRIENSDGVILEEAKDKTITAIDQNSARIINDILSDNEARIPIFNSRSSLYFSKRTVAAKTGTTQDFRDAWTIGYTPSLVTGVWVGNNDNTPMNKSGLSIMLAGPLWHSFMEAALNNTPPEEFQKPHTFVAEKPILRGFWRSGPLIKIDRISKKRATEYTPREFTEEQNFGSIISILGLIKKEDPNNQESVNQAEDPQFKNWQYAIDQWVTNNKISVIEPPQDFDDIHTPATHPLITLSTNIIKKQSLSIPISITASFPLKEVSLFINNTLTTSISSPPQGIIQIPIKETLQQGVYTIKIIIYDVVGNQNSLESEVLVK